MRVGHLWSYRSWNVCNHLVQAAVFSPHYSRTLRVRSLWSFAFLLTFNAEPRSLGGLSRSHLGFACHEFHHRETEKRRVPRNPGTRVGVRDRPP